MQRPHGVAHARTMRTTRGLDARTLRLEPGGSSTSRAGKIMPWSTLSDAPIDSRLTPHVSATARFRLRVCEGAASPQVRCVSVNSPRFHQVLATNSCCRPQIHPVECF